MTDMGDVGEAVQAEIHAVNQRLYLIEQNQVRYLEGQDKIKSDVHQVKGHLATLSGRTGRVEEEVFGHNDHGTAGLITQVEELRKLLERFRGAIWALTAVIALNGTLWFFLR